MALGRVVSLDALGTLVRLRDPVPALVEQLARRGARVDERQAAAALAAEIAYYRAHMHLGGDPASLAQLRERCAAVLGTELRRAGAGCDGLGPAALLDALLAALRFEAYPDAAPALRALRDAGHRIVVVSNWDVSLHEMLDRSGLAALVDGAVSSAEAGFAKPDPRIFARGLELAGGCTQGGLHVGDSLEHDVAGALAAGLAAVLVARGAAARRSARGHGGQVVGAAIGDRCVTCTVRERAPATRRPARPSRPRAARPAPARDAGLAAVDRVGGARLRLRGRARRQHHRGDDRGRLGRRDHEESAAGTERRADGLPERRAVRCRGAVRAHGVGGLAPGGDFGLRRPADIGLSIGLLLAVWVAFFALTAAWTRLLELDETSDLPQRLGVDESALNLVVVTILITVVAPVGEELFFRGFFFGALRNWQGPWPAAVIGGIVFGGVHAGSAPIGQLVPLALFGVGLCMLYHWTGSLYPSIALHALNNSLAFGYGDGWTWEIPLVMVGSVIVALAIADLIRRALDGLARGRPKRPAPATAG